MLGCHQLVFFETGSLNQILLPHCCLTRDTTLPCPHDFMKEFEGRSSMMHCHIWMLLRHIWSTWLLLEYACQRKFTLIRVVTLHPIYKPVCTTCKPLTQMVLALYEFLLHHVLPSSFISNSEIVDQAGMHVYVHYSRHCMCMYIIAGTACVCTL